MIARLMLIVACGLAGATAGGAESSATTAPAPTTASAPATQPATQPVEIDLSSPKSAARTLFGGIAIRDRNAVRAALFSADATEGELVAATADLMIAGKRLSDAAHARFGAAGDPIGRGMLDPADLHHIDDAIEKPLAPDTTALDVAGVARPMTFRRHNDQWRLVVTQFGGAAPTNIAKQTKLVKMMASAVDQSAEEVAAGHYAAPDTALAAIQKRLHEVMLQVTRPATTRAATTQTTTTPAKP